MNENIGIYAIINNINGKMYIGSSQELKTRIEKHFILLRLEKHHCKKLQEDWIKYDENFSYKILEYCNKSDRKNIEQDYFNKYKSFLYNSYLNSRGAHKEFFTEEIRNNMSKAHKGKKHSEELKRKWSLKRRGINHPMYGKHHTEEVKKKIGKAARGRKHTEESKQKMSEALKGKNSGENNGSNKLSINDCLKIKEMLLEKTNEKIGEKDVRIAKIFNISFTTMRRIRKGEYWCSEQLGGGYKDWIK